MARGRNKPAEQFLPGSGKIMIGVGTGNNGGGGLVAARRLSGWGFSVSLDIPDLKLKKLPATQLERALTPGSKNEYNSDPDLFFNAYVGFSQYLPLGKKYKNAVDDSDNFSCLKISPDLPTGFIAKNSTSLFKPDMILTLAAIITGLLQFFIDLDMYLAGIGLPDVIYYHFEPEQPAEFKQSSLLRYLVSD